MKVLVGLTIIVALIVVPIVACSPRTVKTEQIKTVEKRMVLVEKYLGELSTYSYEIWKDTKTGKEIIVFNGKTCLDLTEGEIK
jgi:hypothetical protein